MIFTNGAGPAIGKQNEGPMKNHNMKSTNTTKIAKLFDILADGKNVPTTTLRRALRTEYVSSVVREAREQGAVIYSNRIKNREGKTVTAYRLAN